MERKTNLDKEYSTLMIPVVVVNGVLSGLVSVITSYFFKPVWNKFISWWNKTKA